MTIRRFCKFKFKTWNIFLVSKIGVAYIRESAYIRGNTVHAFYFYIGIVKQNDMVMNPPYGYQSKNNSGGKFTYYSYGPKSSIPRNPSRISASFNRNKFNQHAKNGFRYWFEEKPGVSCKYGMIYNRQLHVTI